MRQHRCVAVAFAAAMSLAAGASAQEPPATPESQETPRPSPSPTAPPETAPAPPAMAAPSAPEAAEIAGPEVSGYVQVQYSRVEDADGDGEVPYDTIHLRRVRAKVSGEIAEDLRYTVMFDPSTPNNLLRDAFVSVLAVPHHEIRVGQQKTQFGWEYPTSSTKLFTINRSEVSERLGRGPDIRDVGVGVFGKWTLPAAIGAGYQLTVVNGAGPNRSQDDTARKSFWGRAGLSRTFGKVKLAAAGSYASGDRLDRGDPEDPDDDVIVGLERLGADLQVDSPWALVVGEWIGGSAEPGELYVDASGWQAQVVGKTPWKAGPIFRAEAFDPDVYAGDDVVRRYTAGVWWDPRPKTRLLFNYVVDASEQEQDDRALLWGQILFP